MMLKKEKWRIQGQKGQSYTEYTIILALMAIACITVYTLFGQQVRSGIAKSGHELAGEKSSTTPLSHSQITTGSGSGAPGAGNPSANHSSSLNTYLEDTLEQIAYGNFTDKATLLGVATEIAIAAIGLDLPMDIRDIAADITNWEFSAGHIFQTTLDAAGILPIVGAVTKLKKLVKIIEARKGSKIQLPIPCFVAGTPVKTEDGLRPIESINIGDRVLARDVKSGRQVYRKVTRVFVTPDQPILELSVASDSGDTEIFGTTMHHPFRVKDRGWVAAAELLPGDELFTSTGGWLKVTGGTWLSTRQTVYNMVVEGFHTYFVGQVGVWVHNGKGDKNNCGMDGGAASKNIFNFKGPAKRHTLTSVNQKTVAKNLNTVIEPGVDVAADVVAINKGLAQRIGDKFTINGRTYGMHDGTLFPISGNGFHQLNRAAFKALGVFNKFGNTDRANQIIKNMGLDDDAIDAALKAWRAGQ